MQQDIRDLLKDYKDKEVDLSKKHTNKFENLLQKELHNNSLKKKKYKWLSIAASIVLLISIGIKFYPISDNNDDVKIEDTESSSASKEITLGNISPEFEAIENYYTKAINLEISELDLKEENKELIDGYLLKIAELNKEYKTLTQELNTNGVNNATIDALISNLQLRLKLFKRLRKQLDELNNLNKKSNELQVI